MKKLSLALLFHTLFSVLAFSQEAQKADEIGDVNCEDYLARMDGMINDANEHASSTIYVLVYEGREYKFNERTDKRELSFPAYGLAKAKITSMKKYLLLHKVPADKFKFIEAGFREEFNLEFWLVPKGATPPTPKPTLTKIKHCKGKAKGFCIEFMG